MNSSTWTTRGLAAFTAPPYDLVPFPIQYPVYYVPRASLFSWISDKDFSLLVPIAIYWGMGMLFHLIDISGLPYFEKYRIHEPEEVKQRNRVTVRTVIIGVVFQQILQTGLGLYWLDEQESIGEVFRDHRGELQVLATYVSKVAFALFGPSLGSKALRFGGAEATSWLYWWGIPIIQFLWAGYVLAITSETKMQQALTINPLYSFLIDTWQYFWHRYFHTNLFLYRHIHSVHHRLYCPYAFGALYNHPLEGFLFDTLGAVVAHSCSFMSTRQAILLFGISSVKTIDDHCGCEFRQACLWETIVS